MVGSLSSASICAVSVKLKLLGFIEHLDTEVAALRKIGEGLMVGSDSLVVARALFAALEVETSAARLLPSEPCDFVLSWDDV